MIFSRREPEILHDSPLFVPLSYRCAWQQSYKATYMCKLIYIKAYLCPSPYRSHAIFDWSNDWIWINETIPLMVTITALVSPWLVIIFCRSNAHWNPQRALRFLGVHKSIGPDGIWVLASCTLELIPVLTHLSKVKERALNHYLSSNLRIAIWYWLPVRVLSESIGWWITTLYIEEEAEFRFLLLA